MDSCQNLHLKGTSQLPSGSFSYLISNLHSTVPTANFGGVKYPGARKPTLEINVQKDPKLVSLYSHK